MYQTIYQTEAASSDLNGMQGSSQDIFQQVRHTRGLRGFSWVLRAFEFRALILSSLGES
jgi:hypothetical protein